MRLMFLGFLLLLSTVFAVFAFSDLNFVSARGRIGPGFFPQIIATLLVAITLYSTLREFRHREQDAEVSSDWRVAASVAATVVLLILSSHWLGALPGMVIFMVAALYLLNPGRHATNLLVGILLPAGLFFMFRFWLNAALPRGIFGSLL